MLEILAEIKVYSIIISYMNHQIWREWWKRPKPMIEKAQVQAQIQVQASTQAQQIKDMGKLSIIGCLSFVITFEYF